uniref:Ig-like domain-containing protein n=1 Tax=Hucho hucho TaxID=62062 RepID=A0A4W5JKA2_9TELE
MFRLCLVLVLIQSLDTEDIGHPSALLHAHLGDNVILQCFYPDRNSYISWYKLTVGQKPQLVSTIYKYEGGATFHSEFKDNPRFTVQSGNGFYHLHISNTQPSDSATYVCGGINVNVMEFKNGIILILKGLSKTVVQQPVSKSVQPGDSVTLNCIIHTETCAGEHSVYWFRHGSGESRPGIIYTNGDRSDQCEKSPEAGSPTQSCVYNIPKSNLSLSDSGTYYCAVASCGEILFGNGTKLDVDHSCKEDHLLLVYCLGVTLAFCVILTIVLGCVLYKMTKKTSLLYRKAHTQSSGPAVPSSHNQDQEDDGTLTSVHYAALNVIHKKPKTRRQKSAIERDTVYSGVRCQNMD